MNKKKLQTSVELTRNELNFNNIAVTHECIFTETPDSVGQRCDKNNKILYAIMSFIVACRTHSESKRFFKSDKQINDEISRHMGSNYWYIIHPFSRFRLLWNSFFLIVLLFSFVYIPFRISFYQHVKYEYFDAIILMVMDLIFTWDIFFNFFTGYQKRSEKSVVLEQASIAMNYLKGYFIFDLLSTLPVSFCVKLFKSDELNLDNIFLWFPLMRLVSLRRAEYHIKVITDGFKFSYVKLTITLLVLKSILITHWIVCVYKILITFIYDTDPLGTSTYFWKSHHWAFYDYMVILYTVCWTLFGSSVGCQLDPFTLTGKVITSVFILFSYCFNIYLIVKVINIIKIVNCSKIKYFEIMNQLDAFMEKKQFPAHLKQRIVTFYANKFRKSFCKEQTILENLSEPLRKEIMLNTGQAFIEKVNLFKDVPRDLILKIVSCLKKEQFLPNDLIIKAGTQGDRIFFIASGTVAISTTNGKELKHLFDGDYFGEIALIVKNRKRVVSATALEFCELYMLDEKDYLKYIQPNEIIMNRLTEAANVKMDIAMKAEELFKKQLHEKFYVEHDEDEDD